MRPSEMYEPPPRPIPPDGTGHRPPWRVFLLALQLAVLAALTALFLSRLGTGDSSRIPSALIGKPVPAFTLSSLGDGTPGLSDSDLKQGRVTLVNIFASWCVPCHQEHEFLLSLSKDKGLALKGLRVTGIAYKDDPEQARQFLSTKGNPYAAIGVDLSGRAAIEWGVYGVPETFVVKGDGTVAFKLVGPLTDEIMRGSLSAEIDKAFR